MSENENTPVQTPAAPPAPTPGVNVEEIKAQLKADFEKQREGILRDLQNERSKRQELEQRLNPPAPVQPQNTDVNQDELGKVLNPYISGPKQSADEALRIAKMLQTERENERAKSTLVARSGKKWEEVEADKILQEKLNNVVSRFKMLGTGPLDEVMNRAYDIVELEDMKASMAQKERDAKAAEHASMPSGAPPAPVVSGKEYSASSFDAMPSKEFEALSSKGEFRKVGDKFVYTLHS